MPQIQNDIYIICDNAYINESGCWEWAGSIANNGYGKTTINNKTVSVHKFVYEELVGPIPEGLQLDHKCRNKICCNPEHLEPVTHKVNMERRYALVTECIHGHPLSGDNLYITPDGRRNCKTCRRLAVARCTGR